MCKRYIIDGFDAEDMLGLPKDLSAKQLYSNLNWLENNQLSIEKKLQKIHKVKANLYLYDVTSSYLEGANNELADYGYNRDKKKGKKQIVIGLLTNSEGMPVAVRVFKGNTSDSKTIPDQINLLRNDFLIKKVTLVGDRGMFPQAQKDDLAEQISYISAIGKRQIKTLLKNEQLQMSLFDEDLQEVEIDQVRYILRCNSHRKQELAGNRADKIKFISTKIEEKNTYLQEHPRSSTDVALKEVNAKLQKLKLDKFIDIEIDNRSIKYAINEESLKEESKLDGCYCLVTNLDQADADKATIHARYKDLSMVEHSFRTMKQSHLEIRPVFLRREDRTKAHVFVTMMACMIEKKLSEYWSNLEITVLEGLNALTTLINTTLSIGDSKLTKAVQANGLCKKLLGKLDINITKEVKSVSTF